MIKVYCDYCGKGIESSNEQVNLDFNAFGCTGFPTNKEYQLHIKCAETVKEKLEALMKQPSGYDFREGENKVKDDG